MNTRNGSIMTPEPRRTRRETTSKPRLPPILKKPVRACRSLISGPIPKIRNLATMSRENTPTSRQFLRMAQFLMKYGYALGPKVGAGSYSKVRLLERISDGKAMVAKVINLEKAARDYVEEFMPRELQLIPTIHHENITNVAEIVQTKKHVFIIMDYAHRGDLLDYIMNHGVPEEAESRRLFRQLAHALDYLHASGVVHRDLKCENILIKEDGGVLLSDFGFARRFHSGLEYSETFCGSAAYASPQLIQAHPYDPRQNDVWSLGCILFILVCGTMPFDDTNIRKMLKRQKTGVRFTSKAKAKLSTEVMNLIRKMLEPDPQKRYTIKDVLNDPWLTPTNEMSEKSPHDIPPESS